MSLYPSFVLMENNQYFFGVIYPSGIVRYDDEGVIFESDKTISICASERWIYEPVILDRWGSAREGNVRPTCTTDVQHVMELYAAIRDVVVGGGPSPSALEVMPLDATPIHSAQPHDSADDSDSEDDSTYVAGAGLSSDTLSENEFVLETPSSSVGRFSNREAVLMAVKNYNIRQNAEYRVLDHAQLDSGLICKVVLSMIKTDPLMSIPMLQSAVHQSYHFKPSYRKECLPITIHECIDVPYYNGNKIDGEWSQFDNAFWAFSPCIEEFKHYEPFVLVDGTHLYGKYGGVILIVVAQDAYHAYYIRHMASNFNYRFKSAEGKRYLINAVYSPSKEGCDWYFDALGTLSHETVDWALHFWKNLWLQHCDEGRWYGHMTTNLSECINAVLKGTRNLPVVAIFRTTYERASVFSVEEMEPVYGWSQTLYWVHLTEHTCDYGLFQSLHYPCRHALTACVAASIEWGYFMDPVYTMAYVFNVYEREFCRYQTKRCGLHGTVYT
ncbi:hypothetical protein Ahy_A03g014593 [Arachis hypogaea]|uniref:Zinc finger PMZ-type domain-containing protein n=1 Tax=Arachis hypogaea TaxID=3818 RepID=A0A445DYE6_ARAHY|nr:hypothetical protein Ahy_A03g014593 [Arachis hypogaea]